MLNIITISTKELYTVEFISKGIKEAYVRGEAKFCKDAYNVRKTCKARELETAKLALANRQLRFANEQGYKSVKGNKHLLRKQETGDKVLA